MKNVVMASVLGTSLILTSPVANVLSPNMTIQAEAATSQFKDVPTNHVSYEAINSLVNKKVVFGFPDGSFKPEEGVTRGQFASMLARAMTLPKADSKFKDVPIISALYDGISRAAAAGLILGDNGSFKPNSPVSNADVAVMLDRMMNRKGKFNETVELQYQDKSKITKYALESIKKMTRYGVMTGSNNEFKPNSNANRGETSLYIYRALNLIEAKSPVEEDWKNWSKAQIEKEVGEFNLVARSNGKIYTMDFIQAYHTRLNDPQFRPYLSNPKDYFRNWIDISKRSYISGYSDYPNDEIISFNGVPYRDSVLFPDAFKNPINSYGKTLHATIPTPPTESGQFKMDLHTTSVDSVTYKKGKVEITQLKQVPKVLSSNNEFMVDVVSAFSNSNDIVSVKENGYTLSYNGNVLELKKNSKNATLNGGNVIFPTEITEVDGVVNAPIIAVSKLLGLSVRQMLPQLPHSLRVEIANYNLERDEENWRE